MRAVTQEHVLFDECIKSFHPNAADPGLHIAGSESAFILLDFELLEEWNLPSCVICPSAMMALPDGRAGFVSEVKIKLKLPYNTSELYAAALSSVLTFSTGRLCKSPPRHYRKASLGRGKIEMAIDHPTKIIGIGATDYSMPKEKLEKLYKSAKDLMGKLYEIPYEKYIVSMQAMRLVHLSLMNKRNDFGLAYLLIVSSIEVAAQQAVSVESVATNHESLSKWEAIEDPEFRELLTEYKKIKARDKYSGKRYRKFIKTYCPSSEWKLSHPREKYMDEEEWEVWSRRLRVDEETSPSDLKAKKIDSMINDSYHHRSSFVHQGTQPPHREPVASSRYFQVVTYLEEGKVRDVYLPNYELMYFIAQKSITKWIVGE